MLSLADRILVIYEGRIVGEHGAGVSEEQIGLEMLGGRQEGGRMTEPRPTGRPAADPSPTGGRRPRSSASSALQHRAGGIVVPLAHRADRLPHRRTRRARDRATTRCTAYKEIFDGAGLNWFFHPSTNIIHTDAYNLSQTLLQTTTLILTGLAVAFAFRCGMFNIGGQGQYFVGLVRRQLGRLSFVGMAAVPARAARDRGGRRSPGRSGPGSPGSSRRRPARTR